LGGKACPPKIEIKVRYESFGGIIGLEKPPALIFVDKDYMRSLGYEHSQSWNKADDYLSAPIEVHLNPTNECPLHCKHCYTDSKKKLENELSLDELKRVVDILAELNVFHIALGGGESFAVAGFMELAEYVREKGIVPNVTTNGYFMTKELAKQCNVFGQVNVSVDGILATYQRARGYDGFSMADRAISLLLQAGNNVGINCVVSKCNYDRLEEVIRYAKEKGLKDVEFLRFKPAGRGRANYFSMRLDYQQNIKFVPKLLRLIKRYKIPVKLDCSFVPMLCYQRLPKKKLEFFAVYGCEGGNTLAAMKPDGRLNACSFSEQDAGHIANIKASWHTSEHFTRFRRWQDNTQEPCKSCDYLSICKGGCHVVAEFVTGDFCKPDPECPWVVEKGKGGKSQRR